MRSGSDRGTCGVFRAGAGVGMAKAVFIHNPGTFYDDDPALHYHFPKMYLGRVRPAVGDDILYYQSGNRGGYTGTAKVLNITSDPKDPTGRFYANIVKGSYIGFPTPIPFRIAGKIANSFLSNDDGTVNRGKQVWAVRPISEEDFLKIVALAAAGPLELPRVDDDNLEVAENVQEPFVFEEARKTVEVILTKKVRSAMFRTKVISAYEKKCAVTGMSFINGGGRAEVDAAHIRAVKYDGTDSIRNGLALSKTVHWMFDRGLIAISDNYDIMISRKVNDRDELGRLINQDRRLWLPKSEANWPHKQNLAWHRDHHEFQSA